MRHPTIYFLKSEWIDPYNKNLNTNHCITIVLVCTVGAYKVTKLSALTRQCLNRHEMNHQFGGLTPINHTILMVNLCMIILF